MEVVVGLHSSDMFLFCLVLLQDEVQVCIVVPLSSSASVLV